MSMLVAFWRIEHSNLLYDSSCLKYLITKAACMLQIACVFGEIGVSKIKCPVKNCVRNRCSANLPREYVLHIWSSLLQIYYMCSSSLAFSLAINKFRSSELAEYFYQKWFLRRPTSICFYIPNNFQVTRVSVSVFILFSFRKNFRKAKLWLENLKLM